MPTKLLDVDVNPAALINTLDDGPMGYPQMVADAQPDEVMRGYRLLACHVVTLALADIARQAAKEPASALRALRSLSMQPRWQTWCATLAMDHKVLEAGVARWIKSGETIRFPVGIPSGPEKADWRHVQREKKKKEEVT